MHAVTATDWRTHTNRISLVWIFSLGSLATHISILAHLILKWNLTWTKNVFGWGFALGKLSYRFWQLDLGPSDIEIGPDLDGECHLLGILPGGAKLQILFPRA